MNSWILSLFETSISMTVLIVILYIAGMLFISKFAAKWRYFIWIMIAAALLFPFRPKTIRPLITFEIPEQYVMYSLIIWAFGFLVSLGIKLANYFRFTGTAKRWRSEITDKEILDIYYSVLSKHHITKEITLYECRSVTTPMLLGIRNPVILLPDIEFPPDELALILEHELIHHTHKDLLIKILSITAQSIHWFNPFIYLMDKVMQSDCEAYCDESILVNADSGTRQLYGESIIGVIRKQNRYKTAFSTAFFGGVKDIKRRLNSVMNKNKKWNSLAAFIAFFSVVCILSSGLLFSACAVSTPDASNTPVHDTNRGTKPETNADTPQNENINNTENTNNEKDGNNTDSLPNDKARTDKNMISAEKAKKIVLNDIGGGKITAYELERDDHMMQYEIEAMKGDTEYDYSIDAFSGTILGKESESIFD